MNSLIKKVSYLAIMFIIANMVSGCGEEREDNIPAVKLTASAVVSEPAADGHGHNVEIPFTDINLASDSNFTVTTPFQYRSSDNTGHSHVIALSKLQMIDLNNGLLVNLTSSSQNAHTHSWNLQGGKVLYEKHCYNCHTNDKRNHEPMNVPFFNASQISAVKNPGGAPNSPAANATATPDPNFMPAAETSLDGSFLYGKYCSGCHGLLATTAKANRTAYQIKLGMGSMGLSDAQLEAIAVSLKK